jgi:ATP-dependent DNA helicase
LLFLSGRAMNDIERVLTQFGGAFGGAAGPIRSVASRTCDLLPVAARVAEILHPTLDLGDRVGRLAIRLTYGVPGVVVDLARELGSDFLRGDYCRLATTKLYDPEQIDAAADQQLLDCVDRDKRKLRLLRDASARIAPRRRVTVSRVVIRPRNCPGSVSPWQAARPHCRGIAEKAPKIPPVRTIQEHRSVAIL